MMLKYLLEKEFKQFFRNSFLPRLVVVFPIMVMLVVPWITTMDIKDIRVVMVDLDNSSSSKLLIRDIDASSYFLLQDVLYSYAAALKEVEYGSADAIVEIPPGFEKDLLMKGITPVQLSVNTVNGTKGMLGGSYLGAIMTNFSQRFLSGVFLKSNPATSFMQEQSLPVHAPHHFLPAQSEDVSSASGLAMLSPHIELITQNRYNPLLDYKLYMIPA